ncbi:MAG: biopolymer transporter ExbD [Bryobacteraceae bacterium]|nr:biopolymer transporter ExbD [Bryobacteraceae bacterium]
MRAEINMTPLIDVLLVLLIICMVVTPLKPKGLETLLPQPPQAPAEAAGPDRTVVVSIARDGSLTINAEPSAESSLGSRLRDIFKTRAERAVFIKAHPDLEFQHVARAIDLAKGAGIDRIGLLTATVDSGK